MDDHGHARRRQHLRGQDEDVNYDDPESHISGPLQSTSSYIGEVEDNRWFEYVPHEHAILDREMSSTRMKENDEIYNELLSKMKTFQYQTLQYVHSVAVNRRVLRYILQTVDSTVTKHKN